MTTKTTTIRGFHITLDTDMGDGATGCWIEKGSFSASLECADATGRLVNTNDQEIGISPEMCTAVRTWAEKNGY